MIEMGRAKEWMLEELQQKQNLVDAMPQQLQWANQRIMELQNVLEETNRALNEASSPWRIWKERFAGALVGAIVSGVLGAAYIHIISWFPK
ncbi:hypothetical protein I4P16_15155 [Enterobacter hormaechei]|uniref:hypothetical protein n=1 Tax=Enterobacter hormaechei TaxID=158836 RepID=UPI0018C341AA|nr:hypothetical protein [Enterobacter hormaechei]MBG0656735.1 hypothetical protein [Enterobacter hormaechei]MCM7612019.1 hypothetical protein [Enterobacter hormaechei]